MAELVELISYSFFSKALLAALLASISCGIAGTYIVARRKVFIAGGITHASFGGIGMGYFFGINPMLGGAAFGLLSALGIEFISKKTEIREDSAIGIIWSFGMALGIIFIFLTPGYAPNLMTYLFGNILTVSDADINFMIILCSLLILFFILFYRIILFTSFDEEYAQSHKLPVNTFNYILIALVALVIVLNIRVIGIILVISYLTLPQSAANLLTRNFKHIIIYSVIFGVLGSITGLYISYLADLPSGAIIIFVFVVLYLAIWLLKYFHQKHRLHRQLK
ncbi:MAG: metal ABC transporter permease [Bacteroidales bacterium]